MAKTVNDIVEGYCKKGVPPAKSFRLMKRFVSCGGVYKAVKRFRETGSCAPRIRSTSEKPIRTKELIKKVRERLRRNPSRSARKLAKDTSVSVSTMQRLLKDDLHVYPYKFTKRQLLSNATKKKRLDRAKVLIKRLVVGTRPQVLWTDEKLFTVQAIHNHQNYRIWIPNKDMVPVERCSSFRRQKPSSVMVWAGVTSTGLKTPLIFIDEGVKINQTIYRRMLEEKVIPWVQETVGEEGITLQQDGATSHTAKAVQHWCKTNFKGFWEEEVWPLSSPDLNPMDFGIWSILEQKACSTSHPNIETLKRKLKASWEEIDPEVVRATCAQVLPRLRRLVKNKGGYIE